MTCITPKKKTNFTFFDCLVKSRYPVHKSPSKCHMSVRWSLLMDSHLKVIDWWCLKTEVWIINVLPAVPDYIFITNMSAKTIYLLKHMIVASETNDLAYMVQEQSDEPDTTGESLVARTANKNMEQIGITKVTLRANLGSPGSFQSRNYVHVTHALH